MIKKQSLFIFFIGAFICSKSQNFDTIKLSNKLSILNDRIFLNCPQYSKIERRSVDIMAADRNDNEETRIVYDLGKMRLVLFAQELFKLGRKDFTNYINESNSKDSTVSTEILNDRNGLTAILSTFKKYDTTKNAFLINSLLVMAQDSMVIRIGAYISPNALSQNEKFILLAKQIFKSVETGTRLNNLKKREESYDVFGTKGKIKFQVPSNYYITIDQKYDFQVFKFHKVLNIDDESQVSLIIYAGDHPSYFHNEWGLNSDSATNLKGKFSSKNVDWLLFKHENPELYLKEQIIPFDELEKGLVFHVAIICDSEIYLKELSNIVESISVNK